MKITNTKYIQSSGNFTVAEIKKLIEESSDTDIVSIYTSPYMNQFDVGYTQLKLTSTEEV